MENHSETRTLHEDSTPKLACPMKRIISELVGAVPKLNSSASSQMDLRKRAGLFNAASAANRFDSVEAELSLMRAVSLDNKAKLSAQMEQLDDGKLDLAYQ